MPSSLLMADPKPLLRNEMKRRRAAMATAQPLAGDRLAQAVEVAIEALGKWPLAGAVIAGYWPIQSEINPFPLMQMFEDRGYRLALPCLVPADEGYRMIFRRFRIGDALVTGPFDIRQPGDETPAIDPDVVLMPLLAFDERGVRLGYGGGYYDRVLADLRARSLDGRPITAWGVAFSGQQLAEAPFEVHDQRLDDILTEQGVVEARP